MIQLPKPLVFGIIALLLASVLGCSPDETSSGGLSIPEEVKQLMYDEAVFAFEVRTLGYRPPVEFMKLEITGEGKPLASEVDLEQLVCYRVTLEIGELEYHEFSNATLIYHGFATQIGNSWETETVYWQTDWDRHSCPGECIDCSK